MEIRIGMFPVDDRKFNHMDFQISTDAQRLLYDRVMELMKDYSSLEQKDTRL